MNSLHRYFIKKGLRGKIASRYQKLGLDAPVDSTTLSEYKDFLAKTQKYISHFEGVRVSPSEFNVDAGGMSAFGRSKKWQWSSLEEHLRSSFSLGVLVRAPLFWQIEPPIFQACQKAGSYLFLNDVQNMPVGRMAIQNASFNTVLTTISDALSFSDYIKEQGCENVLNWIVLHSIDNYDSKVSKVPCKNAAYVAHEIHIFPGVPLFVQCSKLSNEKSSFFHIDNEFAIDFADGEALITGTTIDVLPLSNIQIGRVVKKEKKKCLCGKEVLSIA